MLFQSSFHSCLLFRSIDSDSIRFDSISLLASERRVGWTLSEITKWPTAWQHRTTSLQQSIQIIVQFHPPFSWRRWCVVLVGDFLCFCERDLQASARFLWLALQQQNKEINQTHQQQLDLRSTNTNTHFKQLHSYNTDSINQTTQQNGFIN